jgi:3-dehydroquinate synthase
MSDLKASVTETKTGFHVEGYEKIEYDFTFLDGIFNLGNAQLADCYKRWQRCLAIMDLNIFEIYGAQMQAYFDHHGLELKIHKTMIGEKAKSVDTLLSIVDSMNDFGMPHVKWRSRDRANFEPGIARKEPVLVVGGGLVTDVAG